MIDEDLVSARIDKVTGIIHKYAPDSRTEAANAIHETAEAFMHEATSLLVSSGCKTVGVHVSQTSALKDILRSGGYAGGGGRGGLAMMMMDKDMYGLMGGSDGPEGSSGDAGGLRTLLNTVRGSGGVPAAGVGSSASGDDAMSGGGSSVAGSLSLGGATAAAMDEDAAPTGTSRQTKMQAPSDLSMLAHSHLLNDMRVASAIILS